MTRFAALVTLVAVLLPLKAEALTCITRGSEIQQVERAYATSNAVFSAFVESTATLVTPDGSAAAGVKLRVMQVWKGTLHPGDTVTAFADEDYPFAGGSYAAPVGSGMLVYAAGLEPYVLGACGRSGVLHSRTQDIPLLNRLSQKPEFKLGR